MKNKAIGITLLSAALFATGGGGAFAQTATQDLKDAQCKIDGTARDMKNYSFSEKEKFTQIMKNDLAGVNKSLDQLDLKINKAGAETKAEAKQKLDILRVKSDQLGRQLDATQSATESTWEGVKTDCNNAYTSLKEDVKRDSQWVSNKIDS
jgi:hypothetical protein